jgi:hypothetical protein
MSGNGTVLFQGYGENGYPGGGIAIDTSGNVWIGDDLMGTVTELSNTGAIISPIKGFTGGGLNDSVGLAIDASGHIWVANFGALVSELSSSGTPVTGSPFSGGGVGDAFRIAIDGSGNVWVGNYYLVSELSNSGAPLSPSTGIGSFYYFCYGLVVDGSGNVWRSDGYGIAELIGIATPVVTPLAAGVKNNTLGTRP